MSDALNRTDFENLIDEYLRGELSQSKQRSFDDYLQQHPEAKPELEEVRKLFALTEEMSHDQPPADFAEQAAAGLLQQLDSSGKKSRGWFRQPAFAWSIAASVLVVLGLTLWPTDSSFVYARLIASLKAVESVKVEGWIRGEDGVVIPYRQWVIADGTLRAELGQEGHKRIVVLKGDERTILDNDGRLYRDIATVGEKENLDDVFSCLQSTYQSSDASQSSFEYSKEDLGDVVRFKRRDFASLGDGPSNRKWVMEVDRETALPTLLQVHQQIDGRWLQVSDLRFTEFNTPAADDLFLLEGKTTPLSEESRERFWFELFIFPGSIRLPAVHVPNGGLQLRWPTAEEMPKGISSGVSFGIAGGIDTQEFQAMSLESLVQGLTGQRVLANEVAKQRISLLFSSKAVMPWQEKLRPVLDHLGLDYELISEASTARRYIFEQDGRMIPLTAHRFKNYSVNADTSGYKYLFEKTPLQRVAMTMLGNCNHQDAYTDNDTLEFVWNGDPAANPFDLNVDLQCEIPHATFGTNVEYLREHFGINMTIEKKKTKTMEIRLVKK